MLSLHARVLLQGSMDPGLGWGDGLRRALRGVAKLP
jgi:hypothetical protein